LSARSGCASACQHFSFLISLVVGGRLTVGR
jgi:hypothetical protein